MFPRNLSLTDRPPLSPNKKQSLLKPVCLRVSDLQIADSGVYTCTVTSASGAQSSASASLTVANPTNPNIRFNRLDEPATYPSAPQRPQVTGRNATAVTLTWRPGQQIGASALRGYTVEYFSPDTAAGWVVALRRVSAETVAVEGLRADTTYVFGVRAENGQGVSPLSELSAPVHTLAAPAQGVAGRQLAEAGRRLDQFTVQLQAARPISATAVNLNWKVGLIGAVHLLRFDDATSASIVWRSQTSPMR